MGGEKKTQVQFLNRQGKLEKRGNTKQVELRPLPKAKCQNGRKKRNKEGKPRAQGPNGETGSPKCMKGVDKGMLE